MKFKSILKFIVVGIIIICLYLSFILNIESFTLSYNNKTQEYENTYYRRDNSSDILSKISYASNADYKEPSESNIDVIKYNKIIRNIIKKYSYIEDDEINSHIRKLKSKERISLIYNELMYINEVEYRLIFTLDANNIEYRTYNNVKYDANVGNQAVGIQEEQSARNENKDIIYEKAKAKLEELGIVEKFGFEPETLYVQYFSSEEEIQGENLDDGVYVIEDNKNHIKLEIEVPSYEIISLQIGFEDYRTVE